MPVKIIFAVFAAIYPILVFCLLAVFHLPVRVLSLCITAMGFAFFLSASVHTKSQAHKDGQPGDKVFFSRIKPFITATMLMLAGCLCFFTNQAVFLKFYPIVITSVFLVAFASTFFSPPTIIFRFATMTDKSIIGSPYERCIASYCRKVCIAWCTFFVCNILASVCTSFASYEVWTLYNGLISYIIMGLLFAVEFVIRRSVNKKMTGVYTISTFRADSRPDDYVLCYEGTYSAGKYKTWHDFLVETAKMRAFLNARPQTDAWILHCEDYWYFLVTFVSLLQCSKKVLLTQNITPSYMNDIRSEGDGFLTDQKICETESACACEFIPAILDAENSLSEADIRCAPAFAADDTRIVMFTSGSTGRPKTVNQRMTEFENDNAFIISKWAKEFTQRKLITTVSQHHIYGFLFGISLPFALGVPFRRKRIEFPEEFETLTDDRYIIIATPAFLKRTVEVEDKLTLDNCFIFTSGGVLTPDVAKKTDEVFGFWPLEVYGSTETSGIAYRQSKNGLEWTPFDNAKIWKGQDGCLVIISPYVRDPAGFATADLVEIYEDGRFLLKGRSDSVVKIEEKRISLPEVENRILETGLVSDVKVIPMEDRRQYLAAAVQLNKEGHAKFDGERKLVINTYFHDFLMKYFENVVIPKKWRFVDALPTDVQGKKHKEEIKALFEKNSEEDTSGNI